MSEDIVVMNKADEPRISSRAMTVQHTIYLSGPIGTPERYVEELDIIRNASETDTIQIVINSPGGDFMTALQFRDVIFNSAAHIKTVVEGQCASAATMIFLTGLEMQTSKHAMFMFHTYSGMTMGKGSDMHAQLMFERKWSTDVLHDIYAGFLTQDELTELMDGKDFWFTGEEVMQRIANQQQQIADSRPKPKRRKS